jgi:hypothetical protein
VDRELVTGRRIEAVRYCQVCKREVTVSLDIRADTIHVDCSVCWTSYELPRIDPGWPARR